MVPLSGKSKPLKAKSQEAWSSKFDPEDPTITVFDPAGHDEACG
jgi:hypothetical protein